MSDTRNRSLTEFLAEAEFDAALLARVHWKADEPDMGSGRPSRDAVAERADLCGRSAGDVAGAEVANENPEAIRDLIDAELADVAGGYSMLQHGCSMRTGSVSGPRAPAIWGHTGSVQRFLGF